MMNKVICLNENWTVSDSENTYPATVPGSVQKDFIKLGILPDPYFGTNEIDFYALEEKDWTYRKEFIFSERGYDRVCLVFGGIDTIADIFLNGELIGSADNMFIPHRYEVTDKLIQGSNILEVKIYSAVKTAEKLKKEDSSSIDATCYAPRVYLRKAQYSFGWDWGPRIVEAGLWGDVNLVLIKNAQIEEVYINTVDFDTESAYIQVTAQISNHKGNTAEITVMDGSGNICSSCEAEIVNGRLERGITISNPRIWNINGRGGQPLYDVKIQCEDTICKTRFGIRKVKLVTEPDEEGENFVFEINGEKIFAKGANWIPADSVLSNVSEQDYYDWVRFAKDANMNMLRVWGGGVYEKKAFYDACDEMGIMVWQDFMFACGQYPDHLDYFRKNVEREAANTVKRLRNHPSIVVWCGNNENNWFMHTKWKSYDEKYNGNYIYKELLPSICAQEDPSRPYWIGSPWGGKQCNDENAGDRHNWNIWAMWQDSLNYRQDKGRFISEFGCMGMPSIKTIHEFTEEKDRRIFSPVMLSHNKAAYGTERMTRYITAEYGFPGDFKSFVYLSQLAQAEVVRCGIEHWRRRMHDTSGTLYWQLNDCWPVSSWASIDYGKQCKALYYFSKRFYANLLPSAVHDGGETKFTASSDLLYDVQASLKIRTYHVDGRLLGKIEKNVTINKNSATGLGCYGDSELSIPEDKGVFPVVEVAGTTTPVIQNFGRRDIVIFMELITDRGETFTNYYLYNPVQQTNFQKPVFSIEVREKEICLKTDVPAYGIFIETENTVALSDNAIIAEPGREYTVRCSAEPGEVRIYNYKDFSLNL